MEHRWVLFIITRYRPCFMQIMQIYFFASFLVVMFWAVLICVLKIARSKATMQPVDLPSQSLGTPSHVLSGLHVTCFTAFGGNWKPGLQLNVHTDWTKKAFVQEGMEMAFAGSLGTGHSSAVKHALSSDWIHNKCTIRGAQWFVWEC